MITQEKTSLRDYTTIVLVGKDKSKQRINFHQSFFTKLDRGIISNCTKEELIAKCSQMGHDKLGNNFNYSYLN